jgi:hypothetical protein
MECIPFEWKQSFAATLPAGGLCTTEFSRQKAHQLAACGYEGEISEEYLYFYE